MMIGRLNSVAAGWWAWMAPMLWQTALLAGFVWALDLILRRRGFWPQVRYALWLLVFARLLVPPSFALPTSLTARLLALKGTAAVAVQLRATPRQPIAEDELSDLAPEHRPAVESLPAASAPAAATTRAVPRVSLSAKAWAMLGSTAVSAFFFIWLILRVRRLRRLALGAAQNVTVPAAIYEALAQHAAELRLRRLPRLVMTDGVPSAAVCGVFRPILFLPEAYRDLPREPLGHILLHELAHLKRRDLLVNAGQSVLHLLYWFKFRAPGLIPPAFSRSTFSMSFVCLTRKSLFMRGRLSCARCCDMRR
jgi:beta-lactamase regulating signal transducer with metallopeptidase domain